MSEAEREGVDTANRDTDSLYARRRGYSRAVRVGLAISFVAHLFVLFVIGRSLQIDAPETRPTAAETLRLQGPVAMNVGEVVPPSEREEDETSPDAEQQPAERTVEQPPVAAPIRPVPGAAEADAESEDDGFLTNAEKLQPKEGDERLFPEYERDQIPEYLADNPYARYEGEIRARLSMMLDSLNLSERQRREAVEWLTGGEGEEWGVSEEGIHLGGIVIPIDLSSLLREEGPRGREARRELRDLGEIRYQDMIGEAEDVRDDRARQMRERTKEELERRLRDSLEAATDSLEEDAGDS
ncbi:MAG: hypothetical protein R3266_10520 [Gemmatimonadota bacterium]|nr:hypothetical protein [Gemmatimonadota bacterium]